MRLEYCKDDYRRIPASLNGEFLFVITYELVGVADFNLYTYDPLFFYLLTSTFNTFKHVTCVPISGY